MVNYRALRISALAAVLLSLWCGDDSQSNDITRAAGPRTRISNRISAAVRIPSGEVELNQTYTVSYVLDNSTNAEVKVQRIETNRGVLQPGSPGWREGRVGAAGIVTVAEFGVQATVVGSQMLTATFVTDRGSFDAPPVKLNVTGQPQAVRTGPIRGEIKLSPNPVEPGRAVTVSYELSDSSGRELSVLSLEIDSSAPLIPGGPGWLEDIVPAFSTRAIARRDIVKPAAGTYPFRAKFITNRGDITAPPVDLVVALPPQADTGSVSALLVIKPNPCPVNSDYTIEYQIVNTTTKDVSVTAVATDLGVLDLNSPYWLTSFALAHRTTTVARIKGTGAVVTSRNKTATFSTGVGTYTAPSVMLIVQ